MFSSSSGEMCLTYARNVYSKDQTAAKAASTIAFTNSNNFDANTKVVLTERDIPSAMTWKMVSLQLMNLVAGQQYRVRNAYVDILFLFENESRCKKDQNLLFKGPGNEINNISLTSFIFRSSFSLRLRWTVGLPLTTLNWRKENAPNLVNKLFICFKLF